MQRVLVLAALASIAVVASAIVGGAAGALYAAAAALALLGLLLPPALRRQRGGRDDGRHVHGGSTGQPDTSSRPAGSAGRSLPGVRRLAFVRELEARLTEQQDENRALRERLRTELEALRDANELLARSRSLHEQTLRRVEDGLGRHRRERALLERELEAVHTLVAPRPAAPWAQGFSAAGAAASQPLEGGSRPASLQPKMP